MSRRTLVLGGAAAGLAVTAGLAVGACTGPGEPATSAYTGDFATIALAAALENQAVALYRSILAGAGKHGPSVPALTSLARACLSQHAEHARTWNAILRSGHKPEISGVPLASHSSVLAALHAASTPHRAAALACQLETQATQTYVVAAGELRNAAGVAAAASIAPVEAMHATMLRFILGEYPVPASFSGNAEAARPKDLTA
jgi:hypothetical protein